MVLLRARYGLVQWIASAHPAIFHRVWRHIGNGDRICSGKQDVTPRCHQKVIGMPRTE
jgi:hypothetical protein